VNSRLVRRKSVVVRRKSPKFRRLLLLPLKLNLLLLQLLNHLLHLHKFNPHHPRRLLQLLLWQQWALASAQPEAVLGDSERDWRERISLLENLLERLVKW
jgi:hypothetical protein